MINKTNFNILNKFGLNRNDMRIYEALTRIGRSKTGPIIKETSIVSSRVYESLRILVSKGLVSYQVRNNVKYYQAELPEQVLDEARHDTEVLKTLSQSLSNLPIPHQERNEANIYEGVRGFKKAYEQHVAGMERGEVASVMTFANDKYVESLDVRRFFAETVDLAMIAKKCKARMIIDRGFTKILEKERPDISIYNIRHPIAPFMLPYSLNISKKEVMISVWSDEPIVFTIKNPIVVAAFQKHFDMMWSVARK